MKRSLCALSAASAVALLFSSALCAQEYENGGPLAGLRLPLFPTQHGEPPGHPGCLPDRQTPAEADAEGNFPFGIQGQHPERDLYEGSVEHWRAYWFKYVPVRSFFDRQSLLKNWTAPALARDGLEVEPYAEPLYWVPRHADPVNTGVKNRPVPVVRCKAKAPVFNLDLGTLPQGLYAVRVIGAVETEALQPFRRPLYVALAVNDGLNGEESAYRLRCGYVDEFYSVAEIYFHAPQERPYRARLWVDEGSQVDLLVHNITLDDALAGVDRRPIKTRMTLTSPEQRVKVREEFIRQFEQRGRPWTAPEPRPQEEQWRRDEALWSLWPRLNAQPGTNYGVPPGAVFGTGATPREDPRQEQADAAEPWGLWRSAWRDFNVNTPTEQVAANRVLLRNEKLGLEYALSDLAAGKALPDPYPYKDDGAGIVFPPKAEGDKPQFFFPIANEISNRFDAYKRQFDRLSDEYHRTGDPRAGRDAAVMLLRMAYDFPAVDPANALTALIADPGPWGRDLRCRRRETVAAWSIRSAAYDRLFDVIQGNEDLAQSVSRFIPWVKTSQDLIALLDGHLVQTHAKRILRYNYLWDNEPTLILEPAIVLGDRRTTDPWLTWLWRQAYIYPNPISGLPDLIATANDRDGAGYIGSWFYCHGEEASQNGDAMAGYIAAGGDPQYDLRDARRYPKVTSACYWPLRTYIASLHFPRIGDVGGPDKGWAFQFNALEPKMRRGWAWTKDPAFAWMIRYHFGRAGASDEEWAEIERAADTLARAPYLTNRSRVVANWIGVLESGVQHDDPRFRRAAMLRIGQGYGHHHFDTLDLQVVAHGLPMTIDDGQRPGYTGGGSRASRIHNVVQVDGKDWWGHSWIKALTDGEGARYIQAEAVPPRDHETVRFLRRQVALIDVDEGANPSPVDARQGYPGNQIRHDGVVTPNSYVFDVVRVSGGKQHTYCFHAALDDEVTSNVEQARPIDTGWTDEFPPTSPGFAGVAPDVLTATWRMAIEVAGTGHGEKEMFPAIWNPDGPRKFTRLHLLGHAGAPVETGYTRCKQWKYGFTNLYTTVQHDADADTVFPAVIEPYAGEPFIASLRLLPIEANDADANRAVAVAVQTKNAHDDLLFADGRPEKVRTVSLGEALRPVRVAAEFAYVSTDPAGLRQAALSGGTLLDTPLASLRPATAEFKGRITQVDYAERKVWIDAALPARDGGENVLEVGSGGHWTTFTASRVEPAEGGSVLTMRNGAGLYAGRVVDVDEATGTVLTNLGLPFQAGSPCPGLDRDLVVSNEDLTKFWRGRYQGEPGLRRYALVLTGGPVRLADFGEGRGIRIWEYGVGDTVRQATFANLRRVEPGVYAVESNVDVVLSLPANTAVAEAGGETRRAVVSGAGATLHLRAAETAAGPVLVKTE